MKRIMLVAVLAAFSLTSLFAQKYENLALTLEQLEQICL